MTACEHCPPCRITADRWCATHSTTDGPVYCEGKG